MIGDAALAAEMDRRLGAGPRSRRCPRRPTPAPLEDALATATHVLYAPSASDGADLGYDLFETGRAVASALHDARQPPTAVPADPQRPAGHRGRPGQPRARGAVGPGPHAGARAPRDLGRGHRRRRIGAAPWSPRAGYSPKPTAATARTSWSTGRVRAGWPGSCTRCRRRRRRARTTLDPDGAHLVIGATGNIGPRLIEQLAAMGARTVVAVSRNPGSRLDELTARLAATGTTVVTVAADATDEARCARCSTGSAPTSRRWRASTSRR